ncbi:hypothetical protein [Blastococcus sp. CCUG 61487]|uniref:hypothetical protein n=1 Tax=Blastococcus sp. CCUG 61487 TaxID=1840703 RepID=UPI0010BF8EF2|nr:hypothetical protein [Blastococcus sp. CCUG 61487]TKJ20802.1 hypothetical protein A6V29_08065 [Blastococcus sp. CCUG 61487]
MLAAEERGFPSGGLPGRVDPLPGSLRIGLARRWFGERDLADSKKFDSYPGGPQRGQLTESGAVGAVTGMPFKE